MIRNKKIVITTGDFDGIGLEVTSKAIYKLKPVRDVQFIYFRSSKSSLRDLKRIKKNFHVKTCFSFDEALQTKTKSEEIIEIISDISPALWVEHSCIAAKNHQVSAIVTAPLSKQEIIRSGLKDIGHTDILKRICGCKSAYMGFLGKFFNVVLATGHIPISKIESSLNLKILQEVIKQAQFIAQITKKTNRSLAVLGLNPHSGDNGIIGDFEFKTLTPFLKKLQKKRVALEGPLVPDVAFLKNNWNRYSCYVALYHDQGLIPFKSFHGFDSGVHITLGLPIIRTSVDHGTAKDIFNKDKASPNSMLDAIKWGIILANRKGR